MPKDLPSTETLRKLLRYEPETGKLFWRERGVELFKDGYFTAEANALKWNTRYANTEALATVNSEGYLCGRVLGRMYLAHRIIWAMHTGSIWVSRKPRQKIAS